MSTPTGTQTFPGMQQTPFPPQLGLEQFGQQQLFGQPYYGPHVSQAVQQVVSQLLPIAYQIVLPQTMAIVTQQIHQQLLQIVSQQLQSGWQQPGFGRWGY